MLGKGYTGTDLRAARTAALLGVLVLLLLPGALASAATHTIRGTNVSVAADDPGAFRSGAGTGTGSTWGGLFLRLDDGPLAGRLAGPMWGAHRFVAVSSSPPVLVGDEQVQESEYALRSGDETLLTVRQTIRLRAGERLFRVTYRVRNDSGAPAGFRAQSVADTAFGLDEGGVPFSRPAPERFTGVTSRSTGDVLGALEVATSQLPGEELAVPVPPWSGTRTGEAASLVAALGLPDPFEAVADAGTLPDAAVAVAWDEPALAPGAEARYEVAWLAAPHPALSATVETTSGWLGEAHRVRATLLDHLGRPVAATPVRFSVSGANEAAAAAAGATLTDAAGMATISYTPRVVGEDRVRVFADLDGDGVLDPGEPARPEAWHSRYRPPAVTVTRLDEGRYVGQTERFRVTVRRPADGTRVAGQAVQWQRYGAHTGSGTVTTGEDGTALVALEGTAPGWEDLGFWADVDGDGTKEYGEQESTYAYWSPAPAILTVSRADSGDDRAGRPRYYEVLVRDQARVLVAEAAVLWRVEGANATGGWRSATASATGRALLPLQGCEVGAGTLTVAHDADRDGEADPEEVAETRALTWTAPLPRLQVTSSPYGPFEVGSTQAWSVTARTPCSAELTGAVVRWTATGANPTTDPGTAVEGTRARHAIRLTARAAGADVVTAWIDEDGDAEHDASEPSTAFTALWAPPPPQLAVLSDLGSAAQPPSTRNVLLVHRDAFGVPRAGGTLRWWVEGANPSAPATTVTGPDGRATLPVAGAEGGEDTLFVHADLDGDGEREEGEPETRATLRWSAPLPPAPPLPSELQAPGDPLGVTISSVGRLTAAPATSLTTLRFATDSSYLNGFFVRVHGGPLDGRLLGPGRGADGYWGTAPELTREGDERILRTTYTAKAGGVDQVRIAQVVRVRDGASRMRVRYEVTNLTAAPLGYRASAVGTLTGDTRGGVMTGGASRFVGVADGAGAMTGMQEVAGSEWDGAAAGDGYYLRADLARAAPLGTFAESWASTVAAQWSDRALSGLPAGETAAYEVDWRIGRPSPLTIDPASAARETGTTQRITAVLRGLDDELADGATLRWSVRGANAASGTVTTDPLGRAELSWTGRREGRDDVTVYADRDEDGVRDPDEPRRTASVQWRLETAVDPPVYAPVTLPDGTTARVTGPGLRWGLSSAQAAALPKCEDGSPLANAGVTIDVNPGAGVVVPGSMTLRSVPTRKSPDLYVDAYAPTVASVGNTYSFVVDCLRETALYLCYTLVEEGLLPERFCVLIAQLRPVDPQGVVFDARAYERLVAAGSTPDAARKASAIPGARVALQRKYPDGDFRQVLSGDPFITPNQNPQRTDGDGVFGWNVSPGTYRVVVTADGYEPRTSREAVVPPPDLSLHVGLDPTPGGPADTPDPPPPPSEPIPEPPAPTEPAPEPEPPADPAPEPPADPAPEPPSDPAPPADPEPRNDPAPEPPPIVDPPLDPLPEPQPPAQPEPEPTPPSDPEPTPPSEPEPTPPSDPEPTPPSDPEPTPPSDPEPTPPNEPEPLPSPPVEPPATPAEPTPPTEPATPTDETEPPPPSDPEPLPPVPDEPAPAPVREAATLTAPLPVAPAPPAAPAPAPQPAAAPLPAASLPRLGTARAKLDRSGVVKLVLTCPATAPDCAGTLSVIDKKGRALRTKRYRVARGRNAKVTLRLARTALRRAGRTVYVTADGGAGAAVIGTLTR